MAGWQTRDFTIDDAASFLGVSGSTIRGRVRAGELRSVKSVSGVEHVRLVPLEDWLRLQDAAALLGVATSTVRAQVTRGELIGKRVDGKWRVKLVSVLEDARCDRGAVELFGGSPTPPAEVPERRRPPANVQRPIYVRLDAEDCELLERLRSRHGSITAAVVTGLRAIGDDAVTGDDLAELRAELHARGEAINRLNVAHRTLADRARGRLVDELYCPVCERLVAIEEFKWFVGADGTAEFVHEPHPHRQASRLRPGTIAARRRAAVV